MAAKIKVVQPENRIIEQNAYDVLNAGLGVYQAVRNRVENLQKNIEDYYRDLVKRGASDQSEQVQKLRGGLDRGIETVREIQEKFQSTLNLKK